MVIIKVDMDEYNYYNQKYSILKAKMIRQGLLNPDFTQKAEKKEIESQSGPTNPLQRRMTMSAQNFLKKNKDTVGGFSDSAENAMRSTFAEAFGDPSLKKLKDDIAFKENQNQELQDEIERLRYILQDNVGENEVVLGLQKELDIKESQMKDRDDEI